MEKKSFAVQAADRAFFNNQADYCVGTGRIGLALQKEYQDQLALVQREIGFSYIRGHGLFSDDMAIYREYEDAEGNLQPEYCFTYLDLVMDSYLEKGIRPFMELGFMPEKLASGTQTVFYWKGQVTPPKSYEAWAALVQATLQHLIERYGREEVLTWPVEVWNEPNLPGFWKDADMEEYFKLFAVTFRAVKEVDPAFRVGGPAICGVDDERWIRCFLEFCQKEKIDPDIITRHHYTTDPPEPVGHYGYAELRELEEGYETLISTRNITDSFPEFAGKEIHLTEFNTSYIPNCPLHDTNQNAAYVAALLAQLGDWDASYSYWTFGDIFEENGVPFAPFHGGFGLVANGCIPKPTFWTFKFFKDLNGKGDCVLKNDNAVVLRDEDGTYRGVLFNCTTKRSGRDLTIGLDLEASAESYTLITKTVDEETCNPLKIWHDLGEPVHLSREEEALIKAGAVPALKTAVVDAAAGRAAVEIPVLENGMIYFELKPRTCKGDRGYDYNRVMQY